MAWVLDLDGVIWLANDPIPGSAEAVAELRRAGEQVLFVTNNSFPLVGETEAKLESFGIPAAGDVVSSAMAAATLVEPGETALVCGGPGVAEALTARGVAVVRDGRADVVVVGFHRDFDYERLRVAHAAIRGGARLVGTNDDATYPTPDGPIPGGGSILAAVAYAAGVQPTIAGKPHRPMADLVHARMGDDPNGIAVGDRPDTDGAFAVTIGWRFALVLSGVTPPGGEDAAQPRPDLVAPDLATLVRRQLSGASAS